MEQGTVTYSRDPVPKGMRLPRGRNWGKAKTPVARTHLPIAQIRQEGLLAHDRYPSLPRKPNNGDRSAVRARNVAKPSSRAGGIVHRFCSRQVVNYRPLSELPGKCSALLLDQFICSTKRERIYGIALKKKFFEMS